MSFDAAALWVANELKRLEAWEAAAAVLEKAKAAEAYVANQGQLVTEIEAAVAAARRELDEVNFQIAEQQAALTQTQERVRAAQQEARAQVQQARTECEREIGDLKATHETAMALVQHNHATKVANLEAEIVEKQGVSDQLNDLIKDAEDRLDGIRSAVGQGVIEQTVLPKGGGYGGA